jgi:exonuclease SbcC
LASKDFDPSALENARNAVAAAAAKLSNDENDLHSAQRELKQEKERLKQWKEACSERERIDSETARLRAAGELARLAGKVLKNAAPAVADRICKGIAAEAQRIFNQINQDPIDLEWKAENNYSLCVTPGERRFAMLSGGEQTKLALAMTLAMIRKFSGLRFAVFDEPTYAVDADSRQKLADAILEAQKAAALEQLIVVSHDDAFEGKIEHVVMLRKTVAGTEQVKQD